MAASTKPPTPADLAALEHAFASDPGSDAYRPLTEAYLALGRFMEAMVVCKKGVKAHPDDPVPRVLLARIYGEQGKDRKALEELQAVLQAHPRDVLANRLAGVLHFRLGEKEPGAAALRRAAEVAPGDPEVQEALRKHGVSTAPTAPRPPPPPHGSSRPSAPRAPTGAAGGPPVAPRAFAPAVERTRAPAADVLESVDVSLDATPSPFPTPRPARNVAYAEELAERYQTQEFTLTDAGTLRRRKKGGRAAVVATLAIVVFGGVLFAAFSVLTKMHGEREKQISKLLNTDIRELLEKDSYVAYKQAADKCREILALNDESLAGHAFLAYVDAILAGEHGEGDAVKTDALRHVDAARRLGRHSHLIAAEAYLKFQGGDPAGALKDLRGVLEGDQGAQSTFLQGVLGILQLQSGDLDAARETLGKAQKANPGDVRIAWALAEQYRRRGEGYELQASGFFDWALRAQKEHVPSLLGKSLLLLDRGQYEEVLRAVQLVLAQTAGASPRQRALARMIRGSVLHLQGKTQEGAAEEQEAAKADPSNADIPYLLGRRKLREGDVTGAVEAFQRALGIDPRRISYYADLSRALLAREGGSKQAIEQLKRAVSRLGESPRLALLLGEAYRAAGDQDLAKGQYEKAIALGKPYPDARVALARLYRAQGNVPLALVELNQAIDEYRAGSAGGGARAYVEMAETERARGARRDVVQELYEKALQQDPASCDALWGVVSGDLEAGRRGDKVRQRLDTYGRLCPRAAHADEAARMLGGR